MLLQFKRRRTKMGLINKKASGAKKFVMAFGLFWDIETGLP